jgi:hypothetical protein
MPLHVLIAGRSAQERAAPHLPFLGLLSCFVASFFVAGCFLVSGCVVDE